MTRSFDAAAAVSAIATCLVCVSPSFAAPPAPSGKKPGGKTIDPKLVGGGVLSKETKLAIAKSQAALKALAAPKGLENPITLSARQMHRAGLGDLSLDCVSKIDTVNDTFTPEPVVWPTTVLNIQSIECRKTLKQFGTIRVKGARAGQLVLIDVTGTAGSGGAQLELDDPSGSSVSLTNFGPGQTGHGNITVVLPSAGWHSAKLQVNDGELSISRVELTPLK